MLHFHSNVFLFQTGLTFIYTIPYKSKIDIAETDFSDFTLPHLTWTLWLSPLSVLVDDIDSYLKWIIWA